MPIFDQNRLRTLFHWRPFQLVCWRPFVTFLEAVAIVVSGRADYDEGTLSRGQEWYANQERKEGLR
jgi:hypothetical protein